MKNEGEKKRRRRKGTGGVWKRVCKDSSTQTWVIDYVNEFGKRKVKAVGKKKSDAIKKLNAAIKQVEKGKLQLQQVPVKPPTVSFGEFANKWFKKEMPHLKPSTQIAYEAILRKHLIPRFGLMDIGEITREHVQKFANDFIVNENVSAGRVAPKPQTLKNVLIILHRVLQDALLEDKISKNPCIGISKPPVVKRESRPLTSQEIPSFLETCQEEYPQYLALFFTAIHTGMRIGELLALGWDNFDAERKAIHVQQSLFRRELITPKTQSSNREICFGNDLLRVLQQHKKDQARMRLRAGQAWLNHNLIFAKDNGDFQSASVCYHAFQRLLKKAGLGCRTLHSLRKSFASIEFEAGVDVKTVQELLGHSTCRMTLETYAYSNERLKRNAAAGLESVLHNATIDHQSAPKEDPAMQTEEIIDDKQTSNPDIRLSKSMNTICCHVPKVRRS
jgi:integrase